MSYDRSTFSYEFNISKSDLEFNSSVDNMRDWEIQNAKVKLGKMLVDRFATMETRYVYKDRRTGEFEYFEKLQLYDEDYYLVFDHESTRLTATIKH